MKRQMKTQNASPVSRPRLSDIPPAVLAKLTENTHARQTLKRAGYQLRRPRNTPGRNVMFLWVYAGVEYSLHATKGWRLRAV
jgi:hypothetical protein